MPAGTLAWIARRERCRLRRREPEDLPFTWWYEIIGELPIGSTPACNMGLEGMVSKRADSPYRRLAQGQKPERTVRLAGGRRSSSK